MKLFCWQGIVQAHSGMLVDGVGADVSGPLSRRRCAALDTFEAMLGSGCRPHAAVYSSIIDVLWQTGISWAQAKALHLFTTAVQCAPTALAP